jgi:AraC family transcriptional regulator
VSVGECKDERGSYVPYSKYPNSFNLAPIGIIPAVRVFSQSDFMLCALESGFVKGVEEEISQKSASSIPFRTGFHDTVLYQLVTLLSTEVTRGGLLGVLYADHLAHALTVKLLSLGEEKVRNARAAKSRLPKHLLQRVLERMHNFDSGLDLETLAAETGYSRSHFLRMFHATTGQTPHQYLLRMQVERAQKMLRKQGVSMIDIASACGFSSHSHMSRVFHQMLGVTPSQYRRNS